MKDPETINDDDEEYEEATIRKFRKVQRETG